MNHDLCPTSLAELEYDRNSVDNDDALEAQYVRVLNDLLAGKKVQHYNQELTLAERMADQYQEFADYVDEGVDFMAMFHAGDFKEKVNALFHKEAIILASIIVG